MKAGSTNSFGGFRSSKIFMEKLKVNKNIDIDGVIVVETAPFSDKRGAFTRFFCQKELTDILGDRRILQINYSQTETVGAIRGMHYQRPPHAEMKLVRCLQGRVWDVIVDLREGSPTFLHWHAEELSQKNARMLVIPEGFAHGFQVLEKGSGMLYLHTALFEKSAESALKYDDPILSIPWPLAVTDISERDQNHPKINKLFTGVKL
jgi:dTDP-4-dehydrorhamnose 3,5-epimerase